jgi:hypothetical protein
MMISRLYLLIILLILAGVPVAQAKEQTIGVYVALADNASQGIVPIPAAIGNGDDPEKNLYWGTAEGLKGWFDRSKSWKLTSKNDVPAGDILRERIYHHARIDAVLTARAYRGAAIRHCLEDFEAAVQNGSYDLVVFIGHNGLMDFTLPVLKGRTAGKQAPVADAIVLCCKSDPYFKPRLVAAGGRPVLLTTQLMYPGAFILDSAAETWLASRDPVKIRDSAARAYAKNQKLSQKSALGVFAGL